MCVEEIRFVDKILDNVHGFIYYTEAESEIINMMLFKRLQSIKQLSIANWVFPGSEHTRFIHSLGVMYIGDKIASGLIYHHVKEKLCGLLACYMILGIIRYPMFVSFRTKRARMSFHK